MYNEKAFEEVRKMMEQEKNRSAWAKGVNAYMFLILDTIEDRAAWEGHNPYNDEEFKDFALNGAKDWTQASYGGCYLIYDSDIAELLCNPTELKKTKGGQLPPNKNEQWLDTQARALYQAYIKLKREYSSYLWDGMTAAEIINNKNNIEAEAI